MLVIKCSRAKESKERYGEWCVGVQVWCVGCVGSLCEGVQTPSGCISSARMSKTPPSHNCFFFTCCQCIVYVPQLWYLTSLYFHIGATYTHGSCSASRSRQLCVFRLQPWTYFMQSVHIGFHELRENSAHEVRI